MFEGKTILVTGGTGSFGNDFVKYVLARYESTRMIVFSRDEKKQHDMRLLYHEPRLSFVIGDVRDRHQVARAMRGVDFVFHAAALKQVPSCEFFPMEAVQTNIMGTHHVLEAAEMCGVEKLVVLSTDKAVYPINAMGQSKALMEKLMLARSQEPQATVTFCGVRYGNVMYSRGSVIPLFIDQIKRGEPLTVTHPDMTRLLLPLSEAVELVAFAMDQGKQGDILVRKAPAAAMGDLAEAMLNLFESDNGVRIVGVRAGEKMHEVLITAEEFARAEEFDEYYRVSSHQGRNYDEFFSRGVKPEARNGSHEANGRSSRAAGSRQATRSARFAADGYTSENARRLSVREVEQLLLSLPDVQREREAWLGQRRTRPNVRIAA